MKMNLLLFNVPFPPIYFKRSYFCFGITIQLFLFSKLIYLISFLCWEDGWRTERLTKPRGTLRNPRERLEAFFLQAWHCQLPSGIPGDSARAVIGFNGFPACNRLIYHLQEVVEDYCPVSCQNNLPVQIYLECHLNCHQLYPNQCFVLHGNLSFLSPWSKSDCHLCRMKLLVLGAGPAMALGTAVPCGHMSALFCSAEPRCT